MKTFALAAVIFLVLPMARGQNLVPNGSFEEYAECPDALNQMDRAVGWSRYRGSPDYFNRCDVFPHVGVPLNWFGWQEPATGDAYAGVVLWQDFPANTREHLGTMLTEPLQPEMPVYVSFKVSPATGGSLEDMRWTVEGAGLRFTMAPYLHNGLAPLPNNAALYMGYTPMDTSAWYQISGMYIPDSAYQYVVLGNFFADTLITPVVLSPNSFFPAAYVYYDDVCVSYAAEDCDIGTGLAEPYERGRMRAYPMPFTDRCTVVFDRSHAETFDLELSDLSGRPVWRGTLPPGQRSVEVLVPNLPAAAYALRVTSPMGALRPIVLIHVSP